jgi:hypothetical protein
MESRTFFGETGTGEVDIWYMDGSNVISKDRITTVNNDWIIPPGPAISPVPERAIFYGRTASPAVL